MCVHNRSPSPSHKENINTSPRKWVTNLNAKNNYHGHVITEINNVVKCTLPPQLHRLERVFPLEVFITQRPASYYSFPCRQPWCQASKQRQREQQQHQRGKGITVCRPFGALYWSSGYVFLCRLQDKHLSLPSLTNEAWRHQVSLSQFPGSAQNWSNKSETC